ncbi:MAG: ABC transporter permease subunit, partial [Lachnospiraceae bacterium]|nr:ABC transporter permease subunit [Lachnospiraceae bacterium]
MKKLIRKTAIVLLWLILWQLFACWVNNSVLFASPLDTVKALGMLVVEVDFFKTLLVSLGKITIGFLLGLLAGAVLGTFGAKKDWVDDLLRPVLSFMKSVPVAAFVVLLLIWWGSRWLSVAIVFVVVFPYIYFAFCEGLKQVDCSMLEVAKVYQMPR